MRQPSLILHVVTCDMVMNSINAASRQDHGLWSGEACQRRRVVSVRELQGATVVVLSISVLL